MDKEELRRTLVDAYFQEAYRRSISPQAAAKVLLEDKQSASFLSSNEGRLDSGRLLDDAGKGKKSGHPLSEYLYASFLIYCFLMLTVLSPRRIFYYLDLDYVFSRYQYFHSIFEKRVIVQLILRKEASAKRRKGSPLEKGFTDEDHLQNAYRILSTVLPLRELQGLSPYFDEELGRIVLKGERTYFYESKLNSSREEALYLRFKKMDGIHLYSLVEQGEDKLSEASIALHEKEVEVTSFSERYLIVPRAV